MGQLEFIDLYRAVMQRYPLENEKILQGLIFDHLKIAYPNQIEREYRLDDKNTIDFLLKDSIGIEVKIKGTKKAIYRQIARYTFFDKVKEIVVLTSRQLTLPKTINDKPCHVFNLSLAWL